MPRPRFPILAAVAAALACGGGDDAATDTTAARDAGAADPCGAAASTQVSPAGIGPLRVGARVGDLPASCATRDTSFSIEGMQETGRIVTIAGAPVVAMTSGSAEGVVSRIIVADPTFRTEFGVGVGSTVADLRRGHGRICAFEGEGNTVVQAASMPGVSFRIDWSSADAPDELLNEVFGGAEPSAAIDTARIDRLWIYEDRSACGGS